MSIPGVKNAEGFIYEKEDPFHYEGSLHEDPSIRILNIGEVGVTNNPEESLKTLALGSCVAILFYDGETGAAGMAHIALPDSTVSPDRAEEHPGFFADTAIPALMDAMKTGGCRSNCRNWVVKLVGGANVSDDSNTFNIGKRNAATITKQLMEYGMRPLSHDLGGNYSRNVTIHAATGDVIVTSPIHGAWVI